MIECIAEREYELIRDLVYRHSRIALGDNKKELVSGRVSKRLRKLGLSSFREYCRFLRSPDGQSELADLIDVISTNHTSFFRDPEHFAFLREEVLPKLCAGTRLGTRNFRAWSAACSSGEEPYSIAICLADFFSQHENWMWQVDATDISRRVIERAARAIYDAGQVRLLKREWLQRFFQVGVREFEGALRLKKELRARVRFSHLNLFQIPYPFAPGFHVIFCRNVMIYFDRPSQQQLIESLSRYLVLGGYLFVGPSESLMGVQHSLHYVKPSIYRKER